MNLDLLALAHLTRLLLKKPHWTAYVVGKRVSTRFVAYIKKRANAHND